jgi:hypothetical protein
VRIKCRLFNAERGDMYSNHYVLQGLMAGRYFRGYRPNHWIRRVLRVNCTLCCNAMCCGWLQVWQLSFRHVWNIRKVMWTLVLWGREHSLSRNIGYPQGCLALLSSTKPMLASSTLHGILQSWFLYSSSNVAASGDRLHCFVSSTSPGHPCFQIFSSNSPRGNEEREQRTEWFTHQIWIVVLMPLIYTQYSNGHAKHLPSQELVCFVLFLKKGLSFKSNCLRMTSLIQLAASIQIIVCRHRQLVSRFSFTQGKGKGKVYPSTGREGSEGCRGVALLLR